MSSPARHDVPAAAMTGTSAPPVITIDGPSATGKGALCSSLSRWLGWNLLDSGALYRILASLARQEGVALTDAEGVAALVGALNVSFVAQPEDEPVNVILDGADVSMAIRSEDCGSDASILARHARVRELVLGWQRSFRRAPGLVTDGRDMGTIVFPDAELKLFLTASPQERAKRRYKQLNAKGIDVKLARLVEEIARRDTRDWQRAVAPLKPASDAVIIDTSASRLEAVFDQVAALVQERLGWSGAIQKHIK